MTAVVSLLCSALTTHITFCSGSIDPPCFLRKGKQVEQESRKKVATQPTRRVRSQRGKFYLRLITFRSVLAWGLCSIQRGGCVYRGGLLHKKKVHSQSSFVSRGLPTSLPPTGERIYWTKLQLWGPAASWGLSLQGGSLQTVPVLLKVPMFLVVHLFSPLNRMLTVQC